ncbi:hypothetical protein HPTD01_2834 [Halomonas sp. TD01]|nr:hypothetical protein HPTD01_2834 [Halomonas sp. TD01]
MTVAIEPQNLASLTHLLTNTRQAVNVGFCRLTRLAVQCRIQR